MTSRGSVRQAYMAYLRTSDGVRAYAKFKALLYAGGDSLSHWICSAVLPHATLTPGRKGRLCDIGAGDGERTKRVVQHLQSQYGVPFDVDAVEQSSLYAESLRRNLRTVASRS